MRKIVLKTAAFTLVSLGLLFTACKKNDKDESDTDTSPAEEQSITASLSNEMLDVTDDATDKNSTDISLRVDAANDNRVIKCATITRFNKDSSNVDTAIVDFGNGSVCKDGKTRSGQLTIVYTGGTKFRKLNSNATITSTNYAVNGHQFNGTKTITNVTPQGGNLKYNVQVNGTITTKTGTVLTYSANRTREWVAGATTLTNRADDVINVTGSETSTNASTGRVWNANILTPLVRKFAGNCAKHFVQGTVEVTITNKPTRLIDYGNGTCDNVITVTINGKTFNINLK